MDKDLLKFENRSDDWLAKQRKEESLVSAWDFDEGKRIKEYHQENCEAREIKEEHERAHRAQYVNQVLEKKSQSAPNNKLIGIAAVIFAIFIVSTILMIFGSVFKSIFGARMSILLLVIILIIFATSLLKNVRRK